MSKQVCRTSFMLTILLGNFLWAQAVNPGDGMRIIIYNITDSVSGDYFVRQDGTVQFPYIGMIYTQGRTFENIQDEIIARYRNIYHDPEIAIQPLYKVNVLGEVHSPGMYYITGVEKFSDLLAMAGGETEAGNLRNIYLIRSNEKIKIDAAQILHDGYRLDDIGLQSGDDIYVPRKSMMSFRNASVLLSAAALIVTTIGVLAD